jgi:hypothetical protein
MCLLAGNRAEGREMRNANRLSCADDPQRRRPLRLFSRSGAKGWKLRLAAAADRLHAACAAQ